MTDRVRQLGLLGALLWCLLTVVTLNAALLLLVLVSPAARHDIISLGALEVLVLGGICYLLVVIYRPGLLESRRPGLWSVFGLGPSRALALWFGIGLGLSVKFPADGLRGLVESRWPTPEAELAARAELLRHDTPGQMLALFLVIGLIGPVVEELLYRGVLFRLLEESHGLAVALAFTTVAFALGHSALRDWPSLLLVAFVLGYVRARAGTVWPSLAAHVTFNSATLFAVFTGLQEQTDPSGFGPWVFIITLALSLLLLLYVGKVDFGRDEHE